MLPTKIESAGVTAQALPPAASRLSLPSAFPVALSEQQLCEIETEIGTIDFAALPLRDIAMLGAEAEADLHRTLGAFLTRIEKNEQPRIFKLVEALREQVDREDLPGVADRILNSKPGLFDRLVGIFNPKALARAGNRAFEEARRLATGKSKKLSDVIQAMEQELRQEQTRLDSEIRTLEQLKDSYRERFVDFAHVAAFMIGFLNKARTEAQLIEAQAGQVDQSVIQEMRDKLQALESRALAIEGTLSRLPSDQLVIRQLQNAGIATLQEVTTTASSRFASIKMTLLTIHGALVTQGVQRLAQQGADLDRNLLAVRSSLMKDVVTKAASAPGDNRLAQAEQLKAIVNDTRALANEVEQARVKNREKFDQARQIFAEVRQEMGALGTVIRPDKSLLPQLRNESV